MRLKELSEAIGVSGDESTVRKLILSDIKDHLTGLHIDSIGNITGVQGGTGKKRPRVMIAAHMDEIGFMVTGYDSSGAIRFTSVGGVDDRILPGLRVKVGSKQLPGVIMAPPIHLNQDQNTRKIGDLRIDIGASSKNAAESQVKIGERIAFDSYYDEIGDDILRGKSFDDRVGCSLLIDVLQAGPYPADVLAAFTVQEEIGLRGAKVAANKLKPDMAIVLEGTTAHDVPAGDADPDELSVPNAATRLGQGPALTVMDRSMITPPHLLNFVRETAESAGIPYQLKTALGGGTDGGSIHQSNAGVPTVVFSVPCRYIHAPTAYLNRQDYSNTLALVQAVLERITSKVIQPE